VFASPRINLASEAGPIGGTVYMVEFEGKFKLCQLRGCKDSKYHPDCRSLRRLLLDSFGSEWLNSSLSDKEELGRLWMPCLTKSDLDTLFEEVESLRNIRDEIHNAINYWNDVVLVKHVGDIRDPEGELFFEVSDGYYLREVT
jgi:hypothetical protein